MGDKPTNTNNSLRHSGGQGTHSTTEYVRWAVLSGTVGGGGGVWRGQMLGGAVGGWGWVGGGGGGVGGCCFGGGVWVGGGGVCWCGGVGGDDHGPQYERGKTGKKWQRQRRAKIWRP